MPCIKATGIPFPQLFGTNYKFWDWVIACKTTTTKSLGLPFPFLLTYILKKKGIKGTPEDGPITEHPFFSRKQWNHN
jgi:hypothetical protein